MIAEEIQPTSAMVRHFEKRTKEHIARVANCLKKVYKKSQYGPILLQRASQHDASKFGPIEKGPYIWLTEFHRCKNLGEPFEYPPGMEEKVREASLHHITTNRHHPEFHSSPEAMDEIDIVEMVCDWTAMAQELGEEGGSAKGWADKNVGTKWKFSDDQVKLIYKTIELLDS